MADLLSETVDTGRYPIDRRESTEYEDTVSRARKSLHESGCAVIKDFIRPEALTVLAAEIDARKHTTHYSTDSINPYFHTEFNADFPERHPVNTFIERSSGFVPGDAWEPATTMRQLFEHETVARFLADCLKLPSLYPYADPLAGLTANILDPGQQFTWHFDTNEFAVTVLVEEADEGGLFEYAPQIRSPEDERFDAVQAVLEGNRDGITTLDLCPGDLQIFRGRHSMHRVTRVGASSRPRHAAIFAYTEEPNVIGRVDRTRQLFGRVLPEHIEAEKRRVRSDTLLD